MNGLRRYGEGDGFLSERLFSFRRMRSRHLLYQAEQLVLRGSCAHIMKRLIPNARTLEAFHLSRKYGTLVLLLDHPLLGRHEQDHIFKKDWSKSQRYERDKKEVELGQRKLKSKK